MGRGPSRHLSWRELECHDKARTPYPENFRQDRLPVLASVFEMIRSGIGDRPLRILSAYRTPEHNRYVGGAPMSQHVQGRALDLQTQLEWIPSYSTRSSTSLPLPWMRGSAVSVGIVGDATWTFDHGLQDADQSVGTVAHKTPQRRFPPTAVPNLQVPVFLKIGLPRMAPKRIQANFRSRGCRASASATGILARHPNILGN